VSKPIHKLVDDLPTNNIAISMLRALDFVAPGQYAKCTGLFTLITGETDLIQQGGDPAIYLYNDRSQGIPASVWLYKPLIVPMLPSGAAALITKSVRKSAFLGFFKRITPKADKSSKPLI